MISVLAAGAISFFLAGAMPQDRHSWVPIDDTGEDGARGYIDLETMSRSGDLAVFWQKIDWDRPAPGSNGMVGALARVELNCRTRMSRRLHSWYLGRDGRPIGENENPTPPRTIPPGSNMDVISRLVCSPQPSPPSALPRST